MTSFNVVQTLSELIAIPSLSKEEEEAAQYIESTLRQQEIAFKRHLNNVFCVNKNFKEGKYTILLNSHLDTVKANAGYTLAPNKALQREGKLYGLGSNDAGGALVSLLATFLHFYPQVNLPFNLVFAASAEEEISGKNGMEALFPLLPPIDFAIVGEPTKMEIAVAERGLMVIDVTTKGVAGHAARKEGTNALYKAIEEIEWFRTFQFDKTSEDLGPIGMTVTGIQSGTQHNVVPDTCTYMVDIRVNDQYRNEEVLSIIKNHIPSEVVARSTRLNSSGVSKNHPIRAVAEKLGIPTYGSPTTSDQALMPCESVKMGPGDSARSHTADEFIYVDELLAAPQKYIDLLKELGRLLP